MIRLFFLTVCSVLLSGASSWSDYVALDIPSGYQEGDYTFPPSKNAGDIVFYASPSKDSLNAGERIVLFGARSTDGKETTEAWWYKTYQLAIAHEAKFGRLPTILDLATCNKIFSEPVAESDLARVKSPISGLYPRVDATQFSPGNLLIRRLSEQQLDSILGEEGERPADATGAAYYVRVYGDEGVIMSLITVETDHTSWHRQQKPRS